jgi:hypothetical protein
MPLCSVVSPCDPGAARRDLCKSWGLDTPGDFIVLVYRRPGQTPIARATATVGEPETAVDETRAIEEVQAPLLIDELRTAGFHPSRHQSSEMRIERRLAERVGFLESVTHGFHVAEDAVNAVPAVAPCT